MDDRDAAGGPATLAEALGLTGEVAGAIARIAEGELQAGRAGAALTILEGLAVANPRDPLAWVLLSRAHRALGQPLAARFCAEVAGALDPAAPRSRLARAESLLAFAEERPEAVAALERLAADPVASGGEARRARALLEAMARAGAAAVQAGGPGRPAGG